MYACMYVCMCVCMHVCVYVCMYVRLDPGDKAVKHVFVSFRKSKDLGTSQNK